MSLMLACESCGWLGSPRRLWCPRCGSGRWKECDAVDGTAVAVTRVRMSTEGAADSSQWIVLASVDGGDYVIARASTPVEIGTRLRLVPGIGCLETRPAR